VKSISYCGKKNFTDSTAVCLWRLTWNMDVCNAELLQIMKEDHGWRNPGKLTR